MKKILYYIFSLIVIAAFFSCNGDDDYSKVEYERILPITKSISSNDSIKNAKPVAKIEFLNANGDAISSVNMGEEFYVRSSSDYADSLVWSYNDEDGKSTVKTDVSYFKYMYPNPGEYTFNLKALNGNKSDEISNVLTVSSVALEADFTADNLTIMAGDEVQFTSTCVGMPTSYAWTFQGAVTETSSEANPKVRYIKKGAYKVELTVSRDYDNTSKVVTKDAYITVDAKEISVLKAVASGNNISVTFDNEIKSVNIDDISVSYNDGSTIIINSAKVDENNSKVVNLTLADKTYYNDKNITVSFAGESSVTDISELGYLAETSIVCSWSPSEDLILYKYDFEESEGWALNAKGIKNADADEADIAYNTEMTADGSSCLYLHRASLKPVAIPNSNMSFSAGDKIRYKYDIIYSNEGGATKGCVQTNLFSYSSGDAYYSAESAADLKTSKFELYPVCTEWTTVDCPSTDCIEITKDYSDVSILFFLNKGKPQSAYLDNLVIYTYEPRP